MPGKVKDTFEAFRGSANGKWKLPESVVVATYVWIDAGHEVRSKSKVLEGVAVREVSDLPEWNFDGSSTAQATGHNSDCLIKPVALFNG